MEKERGFRNLFIVLVIILFASIFTKSLSIHILLLTVYVFGACLYFYHAPKKDHLYWFLLSFVWPIIVIFMWPALGKSKHSTRQGSDRCNDCGAKVQTLAVSSTICIGADFNLDDKANYQQHEEIYCPVCNDNPIRTRRVYCNNPHFCKAKGCAFRGSRGSD